ncbi:MAG: glutamate racemase [Bacteroidota bacterium]|nr:glutamate racemase [Candidatus Kapabacteria bacterium]MCS7302817.1 glutamate racemase [Candidatus Kapabacteria bacterium]MCX7936947.1 glutamate racemase [Chlorobiota bacterium]MDW8075587.1 glutamate racemase [Bacteroidota bacterium]MDW8272090.1 glutamate racemase [Bacteroidota bacterium]
MSTMRIGVFDSGVGGLSVLRHLIAQLPTVEFVYLGDTARVPYGNKSAATIAHYAAQSASFLREKGVEMIVVACNTVSAAALDVVEAVAQVPVVGMIEPAARAAIELSQTKRIGVIGTRATIESRAYSLALYAHGGTTAMAVVEHACPLLVALAEEGWVAHPATYAIIEEYLRPLLEVEIDTLILGCTHFPLLADAIEHVAPVTLIDPGYWAARQVQRMVGVLSPSGRGHVLVPPVEYYVTDIPSNFAAVARQFLGFDIGQPHLVALDSIVPSS